jgi:hypothetical protein
MHDGKHLDPLQGARSSRTRILKRRTLYRRMRRSGSRLVRNAMGLARVSCARTFDTRVLEARIAGALSLNSFGEILDSVIFGRRLRARLVVRAVWLTLHENRDDRSQLQACSRSSGVESVAKPSGSHMEAACSGFPGNTREEPKLSRGCAHAACRCCKSRSTTSCLTGDG